MIDEIQSLMEQYLQWLKDKTALKQIDKDWVQVTTPHLDRHNDCLQFYIRKDANGFLLSDDGYIIHDLISSGCSLDSEKRKALLKMTLAGFGVQLDGETLILKASAENFALKKHNFLQAMLAVNDLFYLASPYVANLFYEDVVQWLDHSDIRYTPNIKFTGKSGFDHMFDFVIPKSRKQPERILQTLGNPKKMQSKQRFSNGRIVVKTVRPIPNYLFCSIIAKRKSRLRRLTHLKITISNRFYGQNAAKL